MKTFKSFLNERRSKMPVGGPMKAKSPDEQRFIDKHKVDVKADRAGNKDDVFKATNIAKDKTKLSSYHDEDESAEVYEDIDEGYIEEEQLDELSKGTLRSYIKKAASSRNDLGYIDGFSSDFNTRKSARKKDFKRRKGIERAVDKLTKEDHEQIDELSRNTLGSYIAKSADSLELNAWKTGYTEKDNPEWAKRTNKKAQNRLKGIKRAKDRLTKEDVESIDEVSGRTLHSYVDNAEKQLKRDLQRPRSNYSSGQRKILDRDINNRTKGIHTARKKILNKLTKEELETQLSESIADVNQYDQEILIDLFSQLSEENQEKMLDILQTEEGITDLLDFAITNSAPLNEEDD